MESDPQKYRDFRQNYDETLMSFHCPQLTDMLKDIKFLTQMKNNELSAQPESISELVLHNKNPGKIHLNLNMDPGKVRLIQQNEVSKTCRPLTCNGDGYTLVETLDLKTGRGCVSIVDKAEDVYKVGSQEQQLDFNDKNSVEEMLLNKKLSKVSVLREFRGQDFRVGDYFPSPLPLTRRNSQSYREQYQNLGFSEYEGRYHDREQRRHHPHH